MFELSIAVNFEAAHRIRDYPGKCNRLHGHNWKIEVLVAGTQLNELGMLIDFHDLKQEVNSVVSILDHQYLNELLPFQYLNPTAENLAKYIYDELIGRSSFNDSGISLLAVTVWESPHSAVKYTRRD